MNFIKLLCCLLFVVGCSKKDDHMIHLDVEFFSNPICANFVSIGDTGIAFSLIPDIPPKTKIDVAADFDRLKFPSEDYCLVFLPTGLREYDKKYVLMFVCQKEYKLKLRIKRKEDQYINVNEKDYEVITLKRGYNEIFIYNKNGLPVSHDDNAVMIAEVEHYMTKNLHLKIDETFYESLNKFMETD